MKNTDIKKVLIDSSYLLRRNWAVQCKGDIYEDGLLRSYFGSIHKCQDYFPNAELIMIFDKKYYDKKEDRRYYFSAKALPSYKSDRVYVTEDTVNQEKEKLNDPDLTPEERNKILLEIIRLEKEAYNLKVFNFSKYRILNKKSIDRVDRYKTPYKAIEYEGLEADNLIYFLSQKALETKTPSAIYSVDSDLVGSTNKFTCFIPPVKTPEKKKSDRINYLNEIALRARDNNITRHQCAILSELFYFSHNSVPSYLDNVDKSISFSEFVKEMISSEPSNIKEGETYKNYYNSLMLKDFDINLVNPILEDIYGR